jgi:hypothetical protein
MGPVAVGVSSWPRQFVASSANRAGRRKIDGSWRIVHEHNSTPFYLDGSLRAALDLRP